MLGGPDAGRPPAPGGNGIVPDLAVVGAVAVLAYALEWSAGDLAWSIWIASLILSTVGVLVGAVGLAAFGRVPELAQAPRWHHVAHRAVAVPAALVVGSAFAFAFFFLHVLYAILLYFVFPVLPDVADAFALGEGEFVRLLALTSAEYWPFVLAVAVTERGHLLKALRNPGVDNIGRPFWRVFRMHIFMFVAVGALLIGGSGYFFYLVTLLFFSLPWSALLVQVKSRWPGAGLPT